MVHVAAVNRNKKWFGIAWAGEHLVATSVETNQSEALRRVAHCVPSGAVTAVVQNAPTFITEIAMMLSELEKGNEEHKSYSLSKEYLTGPMYRIYSIAAEIPIGYVTTYGSIAKTAGSEARAVGRAMATNPLYPVVPCHRVVGADLSLVGYGGKQDPKALTAKLSRIKAERQGAAAEREVPVEGGILNVQPAEWVIEAFSRSEARRIELERRKLEKAAAERAQLHLF